MTEPRAFTLPGIGRIVAMIIVAAGLWGCSNKELLSAGDEICTIDVRFLWDSARGADPEGMTVLLYPQSAGSRFWRYDIAGKDGGLIEVAQGVYTLVAVNNDLPGIELRDEADRSVEAVTRPSVTDPSCADATGMLYEGRIESLAVMPGSVSYRCNDGTVAKSTAGVVECFPDSVSTVFTVRLTGADGMERVRTLQSLFDGCARGISLISGTPLPDAVPVRFDLKPDAERGSAEGRTTLFLCDKEMRADTLRLTARYHDGKVFEKKFDLGREIKNYPYPRNVEIIINGLNFPEVPQGGEENTDSLGINVGIDGWNIIEININPV